MYGSTIVLLTSFAITRRLPRSQFARVHQLPADSPNFDRTLRLNVSQTYGVYIRKRRALTPERMLFIAHCLHIHVGLPIKQSLYIINNIAAFPRHTSAEQKNDADAA